MKVWYRRTSIAAMLGGEGPLTTRAAIRGPLSSSTALDPEPTAQTDPKPSSNYAEKLVARVSIAFKDVRFS